MKKIILALVVFIALGATTEMKSQVYYVYDGDSFNILLTCDNSSVIEKISFSADGEWVDFEITNWTNTNSGFLYTVKDGAGKYFTILYDNSGDYVTVTNVSNGSNWKQYRR